MGELKRAIGRGDDRTGKRENLIIGVAWVFLAVDGKFERITRDVDGGPVGIQQLERPDGIGVSAVNDDWIHCSKFLSGRVFGFLKIIAAGRRKTMYFFTTTGATTSAELSPRVSK